jgi:hypothetical protein
LVSTYTINAANTWEQKTVTIAGDTSGTWATDSNIGIGLWFTLGAGSSFNATANVWNASLEMNTSGSTQWIATNGATFYITGVQLEKGSTATSFDYRPYGTELALCQRYYEVGATKIYIAGGSGVTMATSYHVSKRATGATVTTGTSPYGGTIAPTSVEYSGIDSFWSYKSSGGEFAFSWSSSSEL